MLNLQKSGLQWLTKIHKNVAYQKQQGNLQAIVLAVALFESHCDSDVFFIFMPYNS